MSTLNLMCIKYYLKCMVKPKGVSKTQSNTYDGAFLRK